jgi:uncharacterized protein YciI
MSQHATHDDNAPRTQHETFVFLAETLAGWKSPATPEGRAALERHYAWGVRMRASGTLLFAGPIDVETMGPGQPTPVGRITGLLVIQAPSREAAEAIAQDEPFHVAGFRRNDVHSFSIRFFQPAIGDAIGASMRNT